MPRISTLGECSHRPNLDKCQDLRTFSIEIKVGDFVFLYSCALKSERESEHDTKNAKKMPILLVAKIGRQPGSQVGNDGHNHLQPHEGKKVIF